MPIIVKRTFQNLALVLRQAASLNGLYMRFGSKAANLERNQFRKLKNFGINFFTVLCRALVNIVTKPTHAMLK